MDLISVIVPIYKVEAYLDRCVQSIVDQTYTNLEIILVDDGSPDRCPQMCDAWAKKDSRIRVIHKENGGGAQARNFGLRCISGQYVAFVDSDDFLHPEMYERLYHALQTTHSDIAECGYHNVCNDDMPDEQYSKEYGTYSPIEAMREHISDRVFRQIIWNKLYRRFAVDGIFFEEGKRIDDEFWTYQVLPKAKRLVLIQDKLYAYRQHADSIMHQKYTLDNLVTLEAREKRQDYLKRHLPELADQGQINLFFSCVYHGQLTLKYLSPEDQKTAFVMLKAASRKWRLSDEQKRMLKLTHRIWAQMAEYSLELACYVRNRLSVGL